MRDSPSSHPPSLLSPIPSLIPRLGAESKEALSPLSPPLVSDFHVLAPTPGFLLACLGEMDGWMDRDRNRNMCRSLARSLAVMKSRQGSGESSLPRGWVLALGGRGGGKGGGKRGR